MQFAFMLLYVDPGSGAMLWQLIIGSFVGGLFYARRFIKQLGGWRTKRFDHNKRI